MLASPHLAHLADPWGFPRQLKSWSYFAPRERIPFRQWIIEFAVTPDGSPWDEGLFPWITAPGGPAEAYDDPLIRDLELEWASRLGKTFLGQWSLGYSVDQDPCPMLYASSTKDVALRNVKTKLYPMFDKCRRIAGLLLPEHLRRQDRIDFRTCTIFVAWSGSPSTLADLAAKRGLASEVDKWETTATTGEGDTLKLYDDRFKQYPMHKRIHESTPSEERRSRIDRRRQMGDNRRYEVPCPHCSTYQLLRFSRPEPENRLGGIVYQSPVSGPADPLLAWRTAYYQCGICRKPILDEQRGAMERAGRWAGEGQNVQRGGFVVGDMTRPGPVASFQLSSLHALSLTWGDIAAEFVKSKDKPRDLQNFVNQWLAEVWRETSSKLDPEEVAQRLNGGYRVGVVPSEAILLVTAIDVQVDSWPFEVWGFGRGFRSWLVDYGYLQSWDEVSRLLSMQWPSRDGGPSASCDLVGIDCGYVEADVLAFVADHDTITRPVLPVRGANASLDRPYRLTTIQEHKRSKKRVFGQPGNRKLWVATDYWQAVVQRLLEQGSTTGDGSVAFPKDACEDADFILQITNESRQAKIDARGYEKLQWRKIDENVPNDYRDLWRYAYCLADWWVRGKWHHLAESRTKQIAPQTPKHYAGDRRPDGRAWLDVGHR